MANTGIVIFAFATPTTAKSNLRLKEMGEKIASLGWGPKNPIYTQPDVYIDSSFDVEYINEEPGRPSPTLRIAQGAVAWAKMRGITHLGIVCAKPHLWRCHRDLQQTINEAGVKIELWVPSDIQESSYSSWFHESSTQQRTKSLWNWLPRDLILRLVPFFLYKRIAS